MKKLLALCALLMILPGWSLASGSEFPLDPAPDRTNDMAALQRGAKMFVNYCLNCHSAASMRYNRLRDIGLTEAQIKENLLFATDKVGETMKISMTPQDAKTWFGVIPPDLSVIARAKSSPEGSGADYLYTYLRSYYRDNTKPTGWNNMVFPNVSMPHVLWELQGQRKPVFVDEHNPHDPSQVTHHFEKFEILTPGTLSASDYDSAVADLVSFLVYMSEPAKSTRIRLGVCVLIFLSLFTAMTWRLNALYWKDIK